MNLQHFSRVKTSEELAELTVLLSKISMFPVQNTHPQRFNYKTRLQDEIADVKACIQLLEEAYDLDLSYIERRKEGKIMNYEKWLLDNN